MILEVGHVYGTTASKLSRFPHSVNASVDDTAVIAITGIFVYFIHTVS